MAKLRPTGELMSPTDPRIGPRIRNRAAAMLGQLARARARAVPATATAARVIASTACAATRRATRRARLAICPARPVCARLWPPGLHPPIHPNVVRQRWRLASKMAIVTVRAAVSSTPPGPPATTVPATAMGSPASRPATAMAPARVRPACPARPIPATPPPAPVTSAAAPPAPSAPWEDNVPRGAAARWKMAITVRVTLAVCPGSAWASSAATPHATGPASPAHCPARPAGASWCPPDNLTRTVIARPPLRQLAAPPAYATASEHAPCRPRTACAAPALAPAPY